MIPFLFLLALLAGYWRGPIAEAQYFPNGKGPQHIARSLGTYANQMEGR